MRGLKEASKSLAWLRFTALGRVKEDGTWTFEKNKLDKFFGNYKRKRPPLNFTVYQPQTVVDLLEVREYVSDKFVNAFEFTHSHKESTEMAEKLARIKYPNVT